MKKIVFAIQVIALIAMFPVYLLVELNHGTAKSTLNDSSTDYMIPKKINIQPDLNVDQRKVKIVFINSQNELETNKIGNK